MQLICNAKNTQPAKVRSELAHAFTIKNSYYCQQRLWWGYVFFSRDRPFTTQIIINLKSIVPFLQNNISAQFIESSFVGEWTVAEGAE